MPTVAGNWMANWRCRPIAVSGSPKSLPQSGQRNSHCTAAEYQNFAVLTSFHVVLQAHHARWKNISVHQSKCGLVIDVFEQGNTLAQQYRIDKQPVPVDEVFRHQRMSGGGAAKHQDFAARAVLELVNFIERLFIGIGAVVVLLFRRVLGVIDFRLGVLCFVVFLEGAIHVHGADF